MTEIEKRIDDANEELERALNAIIPGRAADVAEIQEAINALIDLKIEEALTESQEPEVEKTDI